MLDLKAIYRVIGLLSSKKWGIESLSLIFHETRGDSFTQAKKQKQKKKTVNALIDAWGIYLILWAFNSYEVIHMACLGRNRFVYTHKH